MSKKKSQPEEEIEYEKSASESDDERSLENDEAEAKDNIDKEHELQILEEDNEIPIEELIKKYGLPRRRRPPTHQEEEDEKEHSSSTTTTPEKTAKKRERDNTDNIDDRPAKRQKTGKNEDDKHEGVGTPNKGDKETHNNNNNNNNTY
eukprot:TRINITY_DN6177_c0_g1_i1.p1 TRINITY_DN6177_c0_g1~~TRINITY_DN6177_c0_g1_i1.p1  ORF type:complete len:159 (-),score=52.10 TRINITY_DN6177_c0_g1_i1:5-448(-)